jgi:ParB family chromosome partitioning protein
MTKSNPLQQAVSGWLAAHPETSQRALAAAAQIDAGDMNRIAKGDKASLNMESAGRLAGAMNVSVEDLLAGRWTAERRSEAKEIPLELIDESPHNPRTHYDQAELQDLANSIRESGLLQPLVVMNGPGLLGGRFELIAGHRRLRALKLIAATTALCIVRAPETTAAARVLQIIENLQRVDVAPMDEARAFVALQDEDPKRWTFTEIGRLIGKSDRFVSMRAKMARDLLPELQEKVAAGALKIESARILATAPAKLQKELAKDTWALNSPEQLRSKLQNKGIPLSAAAFKVELYDGEYLEDDDGGRLFADAAKFDRLQTQAAEAYLERVRKVWPSAILAGRNDLRDGYVWADTGDWVNTYNDRIHVGTKVKARTAEDDTRANGLQAEDCTAVVFLQDHAIKTAHNVVKREVFGEKVNNEKPIDPEARRAEAEAEKAEIEAINDKVSAGIAERPGMAKRLVLYAFLGNLRYDFSNVDIRPLFAPYADLLGDFIKTDEHGYFSGYNPEDHEEDRLWALLEAQDEATIEAMLARAMSLSVAIPTYGGSPASPLFRAIAWTVGVDVPEKFIATTEPEGDDELDGEDEAADETEAGVDSQAPDQSAAASEGVTA